MRSNIIVLAVALLATPLSLLAAASSPSATPEIWQAATPLESTVDGHALEPAPIPTVGPAGISPVDRVAGAGSRTLDAGPTNSTPFSATPPGTGSDGGDQGSVRDRTLAPSDTSGVTPNLGK